MATLCAAWLCGLLAPATASAHAQLLSTLPAEGATVRKEPREVIFKFDQPVEGNFGAVRAYNGRGRTGRSGRCLPSRRHRLADGRPSQVRPAEGQLYGDLSGRLRRRTHRLQRLRLLDRPSEPHTRDRWPADLGGGESVPSRRSSMGLRRLFSTSQSPSGSAELRFCSASGCPHCAPPPVAIRAGSMLRMPSSSGFAWS